MHYPTPFQKRTLWNAATGVSILILGLLLVGTIWLTGKLFSFLQPVLVPVVVAGIIGYVLEPVVSLLQRRGLKRLWAVISLYLLILMGATLIVVAVLPGIQRAQLMFRSSLNAEPAASQGTETTDEDKRLGDGLLRTLRKLESRNPGGVTAWVLTEVDDAGKPVATRAEKTLDCYARSRGGRTIYQYKGVIYETARKWVSAGSSQILGFIGLVLGMIMVPVYLFFFLKDSDSIRSHWHDYVPLKASRFKDELVDTLQEINGYLISFFRGQVLVAVIDGMLVGVALWFFGLPYALIIGVFMAILGVIPYIGNILCLIPACIIGYLHALGGDAVLGMSPWTYVICVLAIFVIVQQINSLVTAPKIVGDSVGLHPLTVIFSMLFWTLILGGFVGALLAVPLTAAIKVLFRRFIWAKQVQG